ncbi:MAG: EcoRV family type II restriction endonuclease [Clostridium sp.]|nr:EcoRV family type II restriction endonuclease [Clostridium sp.]
MKNEKEKKLFAEKLKDFANSLASQIALNGEWTVRGFIDIFRNVHTISSDTKIISKILELHLFPHFLTFAQDSGYKIELATHQNWYPDLTFINRSNPDIKFAVDLKTTYRDEKYPGFCNGFTLGSHGEYFINRASTKNIQYPYRDYSGHFCMGIIYTRSVLDKFEETKIYTVEEIENIPAVISGFTFFAEEKWRIASDKGGSGNTANIGSIQKIDDILSGNGVFANAGEELFDDYWANFGKMEIPAKAGEHKKLSSFLEYLRYRGLPENLYNPKASKSKGK